MVVIIREYPDDRPYPSCLLLYWYGSQPLHIVCGVGEEELWVITAYKPDPKIWEDDFKNKKSDE